MIPLFTNAAGRRRRGGAPVIDPQWLFDDGATPIDVLAGEQYEMWKLNAVLRGSAPADVTDLHLTCPTLTITSTADRWQMTPPSVGTHTLTARAGSFVKTATLNVVAALDGGAPTKRVAFPGDSITLGASDTGGFVKRCKLALDTKLTLCGTQTTSGYAHEGYQGWLWDSFATNGIVSAATDSPFITGAFTPWNYGTGIADWHTAIGGAPDALVWNLGTNDFWFLPLATFNNQIDQYFGFADHLLAAHTAANPGVKHLVGCLFPGHIHLPAWVLALKSWADWKTTQHRVVERTLQWFGGREAEGIHVVRTDLQIDPDLGYPGPAQSQEDEWAHPYSVGYVQIAKTLIAALTARVYA